jgi:hypothetical protein
MDCGRRYVDPGGSNRRVLKAFLHDGGRFVYELRNLLGRGRLKHQLTRSILNDVRGACTETPGTRAPISRHNPIMKADEEFAIPSERSVIGTSQDKAHSIPVAAYQSGILLTSFGRTVSDKDAVDLSYRDRDPLHRRGSCNRLGFQVPAEPASPRSWDRPPVIKLGPPAIQFGGKLSKPIRVKRKHNDSIALITKRISVLAN